MMLLALASTFLLALCQASGNFSSPAAYSSTQEPSSNAVWQIGSNQTIAFSATYDEWAVALYQQVDGADNFVADITGGDNTSPNASFTWTVSTLNASLSDSPMFQLRVNDVEKSDVFASTFFNITGTTSSEAAGAQVPSLTIGLGIGLGLGIPLLLWGIGLLAWHFLVASKMIQQPNVESATQAQAARKQQGLSESPSTSDMSVAGGRSDARSVPGQTRTAATNEDVERAIATDSWW